MCQIAPVDKIEHYHFLIKKFLYNLFTKKENTLHKQRTQQWREYQEKQGHNIDEEYCNSYGRCSLWSKK
jgi:hypothetical protein